MPLHGIPTLVWYGVLVLAGVGAVGAAWVMRESLERVHGRLADRLIFGVPWGTLVIVAVVLAVYLFLQRGLWDWHQPVVSRFRAYWLLDPVGWFFAGLAHAGPDHLRGNLTSTIVFAPIVEYAWGHYGPTDGDERVDGRLAHPLWRAFVVFPGLVVGVGVLSGLVAWGPVIGFSFVVFAFIGCALVQYPLTLLVGLLATSAVRVLREAILSPITVTEATTRVVRPGWFGTAVQGHLFGLLVGVVIGIGLAAYWDRRPPLLRIWLGGLLLGFVLSLWAVWWVVGPEQFVLFRAVGVALVIYVATAVVWASRRGDEYRLAVPDVSVRQVGLGVVIVTIAGMGIIGLGFNAIGVGHSPAPDALDVGGYEVFYGEGVPDLAFAPPTLRSLGVTGNVTTSGVIVQRGQPPVWDRVVSAIALKTHGDARFRIGDLTWSQRVTAARVGWTPVENDTVYAIWLDPETGWEPVWDAPARQAGPVVANHTVTIAVADGRFELVIEHEDTRERVALPGANESVAVGAVTIERHGEDIAVRHEGTNVTIASKETYDDRGG